MNDLSLDTTPLFDPTQPADSLGLRNPDFYPEPLVGGGSIAGEAPEASQPKSPGEPQSASAPPPEPPPTQSAETSPSDDDPFSPKNLAFSQNFAQMTETKRLLTTIRVGKPNKEAWVRTSPDPNNWIVGSVLELKDQGDETYWLLPAIRDQLLGEPCMKAVRLILAVDRHGNPFFWKVALPDPNGRSQPWVDSLTEAASVAKSQWVRVAWSVATRGYEVTTAEIKAEPKWPTESIRELLKIAFRGRVVSTMDHPILKTLRGLE